MEKFKNILKLILKIGVSIAAFWFVFQKIELQSTWDTICSASMLFLIAALLVYSFSQILSAMRINSMFTTMPLYLPFRENLRLYWLGMFYNFFLPGGVGGDGYKVYYIHKYYQQSVKRTFSILLADRVSGLIAIICYLVIFVSFFVPNLPVPTFLSFISPYRPWLSLLIIPILAAYYLFLHIFIRCATKAFWHVLSYSFCVQALQMIAACLILLSVGQFAHFDAYMFLFLTSSIASAIPISFGGIGLREFAFVIGSQYLSIDQNIAVSLSLLFYATSLVSALPGSFYAFRLLIRKKNNNSSSDYPASPLKAPLS